MNSIVELSRSDKRKLRIWIPREKDAGVRTRMSILLHLSKGKPVAQVAESLHLARSTVYRVAGRFRVAGRLADRRTMERRVDAMFLLGCVSPWQAFAGLWPGPPTWTRNCSTK
jgi:hypothetical protein